MPKKQKEETEFDADKFISELVADKEVAQFYKDMDNIKSQIIGILGSREKESKLKELYQLRDTLRSTLEKYANIEKTEQLALKSKSVLEEYEIALDIVYQSAVLSLSATKYLVEAEAEKREEALEATNKYLEEIKKLHDSKPGA